VTWATSVPILVFLGLAGLDLDPMYATDRQTSDVRHRLMPLPRGGGIKRQIKQKWQVSVVVLVIVMATAADIFITVGEVSITDVVCNLYNNNNNTWTIFIVLSS